MASSGAPAEGPARTRLGRLAKRAAIALLDRRRLATLVVLGVWVLVVAWSAGATPARRSWLGLPDVGDVLAAVVLGGAVLGLVLFIVLLASGRKSDRDLPDRKPIWPSLVVGFLLLVVITRLPRSEEAEPTPTAPEPADEVDGPVSLPSGVIGRDEFAGLAVLIVLSAGVMIWTRRRMALVIEPETATADLDELLEPLLGEAVQSLRQGSDPRSAVLSSYAALEEGFAALGWQRGRSETAAEYVGRVLARFPATARPVTELAELYELARFSEHPIAASDQRRAAVSLNAALDRLAEERTVAVEGQSSGTQHP